MIARILTHGFNPLKGIFKRMNKNTDTWHRIVFIIAWPGYVCKATIVDRVARILVNGLRSFNSKRIVAMAWCRKVLA